jgi:hypothetical protein
MLKFWQGAAPAACEVCKEPIKLVFVDGATVHGPWACMCAACHARIGRGLGVGKGQQYRKGHSRRWFKAAG